MTEHITQQIDVENSLIDLALESWKLKHVSQRVLTKLEIEEQKKHANKIAYFDRRLAEILLGAGLTIVDLKGETYDPGMAVTALNMGDFSSDDTLLIEYMVEPIIMGRDGLKKTGTVFLRKAH